jgi:hypothetical protein
MLEIELRGLQRGPGLGGGGAAGLDFLARDGGGGEQLLGPRGFARGYLGARGGEIELSPIPARIDREEQVTLVHQLPGLKADGLEVTRDTGAELDGLDGVDVTGELLVFRDELLFDRGDGYFRRRWRGGRVSWSGVKTNGGRKIEPGADGGKKTRGDEQSSRPEAVEEGTGWSVHGRGIA